MISSVGKQKSKIFRKKPLQLKQLLLLGGLLLVALCLVLHLEEEDKRREKLPGCVAFEKG